MNGTYTVKKLKEAYGVETDSALALAMGTGRNTVHGWKDRRRVPPSRIQQAIRDTGKSYEFFVEEGGDPVETDLHSLIARAMDDVKWARDNGTVEQYESAQRVLETLVRTLEQQSVCSAPHVEGRSLTGTG